MNKLYLFAVIATLILATPVLAFEGNADPQHPPVCRIFDSDPPTNLRTQPNGVILTTATNGTIVAIVDQTRAISNGNLWDFVVIFKDFNLVGGGWVHDQLIRCNQEN